MISNHQKVPFQYYPASIQSWKEGERELWFLGDLELLKMPMVSVVGSRNISDEGVRRTRKLVEILVKNGFCIVSGLAKGVDTIAHETALVVGGKTVSVMGTPIDGIYPKENKDLKEKIAQNGLILSQFAPGTPVQKFNFPKRNDLMAALSKITIVVEAGEGSGTRHQIDSAIKYGRVAAFVKSLVDSDVKWVNKALEKENSYIVSDENEFISFIKNLKADESPEPKQASLFDSFE